MENTKQTLKNIFSNNFLIPLREKIAFILLMHISCSLIGGCLKDDVSGYFKKDLENNAVQLSYFEGGENYINSKDMPSVVNVDEVYQNLRNYLLIDVRPRNEFIAGHISDAINVRNDSLLIYINLHNTNRYQKVIIISTDGQAASYYTCLLRLYGIPNIYAMLFGMAEWNNIFSRAWTKYLGYSYAVSKFNFVEYPMGPTSPMPDIYFSNSLSGYDNKIKGRISDLIKAGFTNGLTYVTVDIDQDNSVLFNGEKISNFYIMCFGVPLFYNQNIRDSLAVGHFAFSVMFVPGQDLLSTSKLQTLPKDQRIVVYSYSGHISAFVTAYLRVLGYDAKSLLYGGNMLFYPYMVEHSATFSPFVFFTSDIRNYPYTTGLISKQPTK